MKTLKTTAIAALVAVSTLGAAVTTTQASSPNFGIHFDTDGNVGFYIGNGGHYHDPHPGPVWGGKCTQGKALTKAKFKYKMKNAYVKKITATRVVVRGKRFGNQARLVLHRNTSNCAVKKFHYI